MMRTTLDLADDAYALAKALARERDQSLARTVSDLIKAGALSGGAPTAPKWTITEENGFPVVDLGRPVTDAEVRAFLEENENDDAN